MSKESEKTCGTCRWWDKKNAQDINGTAHILSACAVGEAIASLGTVRTWANFCCPAHDDGSFEEKVRSLVVDVLETLYTHPAAGMYPDGPCLYPDHRRDLVDSVATVEEALKERGR